MKNILCFFLIHRNDLTYLIGEMVAELSVGHAYVANGERPAPERLQTGLLGAKISMDQSGYARIDKIFAGANWNTSLVSPLSGIGVEAKEGDFILAVNGEPVNKVNDIYQLLIGKAGKLVELTINYKPDLNGSRKVIVKPVASESSLYYYNWVQENTKKVNDATGGRVGISGPQPCIDGGSINTPSWAPYAADGSSFIIEGYVVDPDIVIDNDPHREYQGQDDQLEKAISVVLEQLKTGGRKVPAIPPFPDKSGKK